MRRAGRDIDITASNSQDGRMLLRRLVGEVNADAKLDDLGLPGGLHVRVQHEARVGIESPGDAGRSWLGDHAGRPDNELPVGILSPGHPGVARLAIVRLAARGLAAAIDAETR